MYIVGLLEAFTWCPDLNTSVSTMCPYVLGHDKAKEVVLGPGLTPLEVMHTGVVVVV